MSNLFFSKIFKLGTYNSRSSECTETAVIMPEDLSSTREEWIEEGAFLLKDRVHLTKHGVKAAGDLIRKAVLNWGDHTSIPVANLSHTIPEGTPYSRWAKVFRSTCGYVFPMPKDAVKRKCSTSNVGQPCVKR